MRLLNVLLTAAALALAGCATYSSLTKDDLASTRKYYTGTLIDKQLMEMNRKDGGSTLKGTYLRLAVTDSEGATRYFFRITEDDESARQLRTYYYSLLKGDNVKLDLGFIDANQPEEEFETLEKL